MFPYCQNHVAGVENIYSWSSITWQSSRRTNHKLFRVTLGALQILRTGYHNDSLGKSSHEHATHQLCPKASLRLAALTLDNCLRPGRYNAGITYQKSFATHTIGDWEKIINIYWWGVLYGYHYFLDALTEANNAHSVDLSSMSAFVGLPGQTSYCATKGAVKLLSQAMWAEMERLDTGVTSVHPGVIKTEVIQATLQNTDDIEAAKRNYDIKRHIGVTAEQVAQRIVRAIEKNRYAFAATGYRLLLHPVV